MKALLLLPVLTVIAAQQECVCDFSNKELICKGLGLTDYHQYDTDCGLTFWKIDISKNNLREFPNEMQLFRKVNMSKNYLESLEAEVQQDVDYLDVSHNEITKIDLENKFPSLRYLYASQNSLGSIDDFLEGECNIEHLDVSKNNIKTFQAVTRCAQLSVLDISHNKISQIPKKFVLLTKLQVLDISENKIMEVTGLPTTLKILDISTNQILRLSDTSFRGLTSLKTLDLTLNRLTSLESRAFATLSSLRTLIVVGNFLKFLSGNSFKGLKSLLYINLYLNSIASLSNDTFSDLPALEDVYLMANELTTLPALQFGRKVKHVTLSGNLIKKMDLSALLAMFFGAGDKREIHLYINDFRGDDPEWSKILRYFDGKCSRVDADNVRSIKSQDDIPPRYYLHTLAPSSCPCVRFRKDNWFFYACITEASDVDGMPWLEAAKFNAGNLRYRDDDVDHLSRFEKDEL